MDLPIEAISPSLNEVDPTHDLGFEFDGVEPSRVEPHRVLAHAITSDLREVLLVGRNQDGTPFYASSTGDAELLVVLAQGFVDFMQNKEFDVPGTDSA